MVRSRDGIWLPGYEDFMEFNNGIYDDSPKTSGHLQALMEKL